MPSRKALPLSRETTIRSSPHWPKRSTGRTGMSGRLTPWRTQAVYTALFKRSAPHNALSDRLRIFWKTAGIAIAKAKQFRHADAIRCSWFVNPRCVGSLRLLELEHKLVNRRTRGRDRLHRKVARVLGLAQEIPFLDQFEPRGLDLAAQHALLDAVQGACHVDAIPGLGGVIGHDH